MSGSKERGDLRDSADAKIIQTVDLVETMRMRGIYRAQCIGPKDADKERYLRLRTELIAIIGEEPAMDLLRREGPGYGSLTASVRAAMKDEIYAIVSELIEIEFEEKWQDEFRNTITTVGANEFLDKYFAGSSYTASIVMGLKGTGTAVIADTQASHGSWLEVGLANAPAYSGNRPTPAWAAASAKSKAVSPAVNFSFTSGGTVAGAFMNQGGSATKDNTTGTLVSAGDFTGGNKTVANTDQINVSWSVSV